MVECVIFDCDGTLVDSEVVCNLGLEIKLQELGIQADIQSMVNRFRGWKLANIVDALSIEYSIELDETFITSYREVIADLFDSQLQPIPNIAQTLANISQPKCVASNAPLEKIKQAVRVTNLEHFFNDNLFSSYIIESWKPEPDLFLHAARMMKIEPKNCVVVEDSILGIEAVQRAGMQSFFYQPQGVNLLELPSLIALISNNSKANGCN
jgi:HAD superfamily hydrolase (TIGR01509 family)